MGQFDKPIDKQFDKQSDAKKGEGKGFEGIASLLYDVDAAPAPAPAPAARAAQPSPPLYTAAPATPVGAATAARASMKPRPQYTPAYPPLIAQQQQQQKTDVSAGWKFIKYCAVFIALVIAYNLITDALKTSSPSSKKAASAPPASVAPRYFPVPPPIETTNEPTTEPLSGSAFDPSPPEESMPPVGQDLMLTSDQIAYCLAEKIRLDGARDATNDYIDSDVYLFNLMVSDYNSRCSSYRYRVGTREPIRERIEQFRSALFTEGEERVWRIKSKLNASTPLPDSSGAPSQDPTSPTISAQTTLPQGPPELKPPEGSASSMAAGATPDAGASAAAASPAPTKENLTPEEKSAIDRACIMAKTHGAKAFSNCMDDQLLQLGMAPRTPSMEGLSEEEKANVKIACLTKKAEGAASYNRCLVQKMDSLHGAPRQAGKTGP